METHNQTATITTTTSRDESSMARPHPPTHALTSTPKAVTNAASNTAKITATGAKKPMKCSTDTYAEHVRQSVDSIKHIPRKYKKIIITEILKTM